MNNFAYDNCEGIRRRWLRHIPNALTICNSLFGFAAILYLVRACGQGADGEAIVAACVFSSWLIFSAMIFDAFDGFAARLLNAASMHGIQMDSLSDMVTFGVAPATMVAVLSTRLIDRLTPTQEGLIYVLCAVYLGCAALRLATYNVHAILQKKSSGTFTGLPSPGAAAAICVAVLFCRDSEIDMRQFAFALPFYAAILGLLMTSNVAYIHAGRWLQSARRNRWRFLLLIVLLALVAAFRLRGLMVVVTGYVLSGPVLALAALVRSHLHSGGAVED